MKGKILLVDDDASVRDAIGEVLRMEGHDVTAVGSGQEAVEALEGGYFDILLLDLKMPGMDGTEVMRIARDISPDTRIILLTAHGSMESAVEALRRGVDDYLNKPASTREILTSISKALQRRVEHQKKLYLLEQLETSIQRLKDTEGVEKAAAVDPQAIVLDNGVTVDLPRREIWRSNQRVVLTPTEAKLFRVLLENRGRVLSHRELVFQVQGYETTDWEAPEVLRPLVSRLRRKLQAFPNGEKWIVNVRGTGYVLDLEGVQAGDWGEES